MVRRAVGMALAWTLAAGAASAQVVTTVLDSADDVGKGNAVAYGPNGLALVSYRDVTHGSVKVAVCQDVACTSAVLHTVDPAATGGSPTSIAFGPDGRALIAYHDAATQAVRVAHCADAGCSSATLSTVASSADSVLGVQIVVGADGLGLLFYGTAFMGGVRTAHCADAACTSVQQVTTHAQMAFSGSLALGGDGRALIAGGGTVGHCSDVACTTATFTQLPSAPGPFGFYYSSATLAVDSDGLGLVAATYVLLSSPYLAVALTKCSDASCSALVGFAVGFPYMENASLTVLPNGRRALVHSTMPGVSPPELELAFCADGCATLTLASTAASDHAIAAGPAGSPLVAYYDPGTGDLKAAYVDAPLPGVSIGDATVTEGDAGDTIASFAVTLSEPLQATVGFATAPGTATSGADYVATSGTLTFTPGAPSTRTVTVAVRGDLEPEAPETFLLQLQSITGAIPVDSQGVGTIVNDDEFPIPGELRHGTSYAGDLISNDAPAADVDDFRIAQDPYASYEVVVDAVSGDADLMLERRGPGGTVLQSGTPVGTGSAVAMRWIVAGTVPVTDETVRIAGACGAACGSDDVYRVRAYETTLRAARFNDSGGQTTVLLLHNASDAPVTLAVHFWGPDGALTATHAPAGPLPPHGVLVLDTSAIAPDAAGSLTVAHDAPYGGLVGKAVAIELSTGFAFDTPLEPRPR